MNWFTIALFGPIFWSITNHIDKYLLSRHLAGIGKGALILYSTLFGVFVLPIIFFTGTKVLSITPLNALIMCVAGIISSVAIYLYLCALDLDEASIVVPFYQTIPVFGLALGYTLLNESITLMQILGGGIIILGGIILSIELEWGHKIKFKGKVPILMLTSSFLFALYETLFKLAALDVGFLIGSFWHYTGMLIFGVLIYISVKPFRDDFHSLIKRHSIGFFGLNVANESLTIIGNSFYNFAILLAPVALIMTTTGYQPVFVFIIGIILSYFFPTLSNEKITKFHLMHKTLAILLILIGTYALFL
jgi:uncharacterized membrane protein